MAVVGAPDTCKPLAALPDVFLVVLRRQNRHPAVNENQNAKANCPLKADPGQVVDSKKNQPKATMPSALLHHLALLAPAFRATFVKRHNYTSVPKVG